jgi:hypothetical protein
LFETFCVVVVSTVPLGLMVVSVIVSSTRRPKGGEERPTR